MEVKPGYKQTEVGVIPKDWRVVPLSHDVEALEAGVSVNSVEEALHSYAHEQSVLKTSCIVSGQFLPHEAKKIAPRDISRAKLSPCADTIIISRMNTPALVGECGYVPSHFSNLFLPDRLWMTKIRQGSKCCVLWLSYQLSSRPYKGRMKGLATGTSGSMKNIAKDALLAMAIPYPEPEEQRAIAEALSDVDALLGRLDQLIAKKRDLKQAAMQQLLTGQTRLSGFQGGWKVTPLRTDVALLSGHHVLAEHCNDRGEGLAYLTGPADFPEGRIHHTKFTNQPGTICQRNDILVTVKGSGSGTLVLADGAYCISRQLMAIRVGAWDYRFLFYSLQQNAAKFKAASSGLIPGLSRSDILDQLLPVPPTNVEQTAVAEILSDMDAELAKLEARRDKTRGLKQSMMQELLTGKTRLVIPQAAHA